MTMMKDQPRVLPMRIFFQEVQHLVKDVDFQVVIIMKESRIRETEGKSSTVFSPLYIFGKS